MTQRLKERNLKEEFGQEHYDGGFKDGLRHGKGKLTSPEFIYDGSWDCGLKSGQGSLLDREGNFYDGEWKNDKRHGKGTLIQRHTYGMFIERYEGMFHEDKKHGKGKLELKNGKVYEGSFQDNKFHGLGKLKDDKTNYLYDGEFKYGRPQGSGTESYPDGSSYTGQFYHGYKHGQGVLTINRYNYRYEGSWRFGVQQGYGVETFKPVLGGSTDTSFKTKCKKRSDKTSLYEGDFWNNERHGTGLELMENGDYYYGGWVFGAKQGLGFEYTHLTKEWKFGLFSRGAMKGDPLTPPSDKNIRDILSGYFDVLRQIHGAQILRFKDTSFEAVARNYYYFDQELLKQQYIDVTAIRFVNMSDIYPDMTVKPYKVAICN